MKLENFLENFCDVIRKIASPLTEAAWATHAPKDSEPNILSELYYSFWFIGEAMSGTDRRIHFAESEVLSQLNAILPYEDQASPEILFDLSINRSPEQWAKIEACARSKPHPLELLEIYDEDHGTNFSDALRHLYLEFAIVVANADGVVREEEDHFLEELKNILYHHPAPNESAPPLHHKTLTTEAVVEIKPAPIDEPLNKLANLVGLEPVKSEIASMINLIQINKLRTERGLPTLSTSNHLVFYGNPGTGKTTVARLLAEIYKSLGILSKGHLIETDRSNLVAGYVGQTAIKVREVAAAAIGGILFIDEAYTLNQEGNDYGKEAIDTILKIMEDYRSDFIVIAAGYPKKMANFLESNPGLKSRFNKFLEFPDYSPTELHKVFQGMIKDAGLQLSDRASAKAQEIFEAEFLLKDEYFGNGRFVRNFFQDVISMQANRLINLSSINDHALRAIEEEDIYSASKIRAH